MLPVEEILATPPLDLDRPIGESRDGRPVHGLRFGRGSLRVSLVAGCHADEPVGPALLEVLAGWLSSRPEDAEALSRVRWTLIPHMNPDGEVPNRAWTGELEETEDSTGARDRAYLLHRYVPGVVRELPGDDVEFGFPRGPGDEEARPETRAAAEFLGEEGPYHLHASLHGMGFGHGPWFLLESFWTARTAELRKRLRDTVRSRGYRLHDVDRGGEKGFWRIGPGFTTRPDSRAMRDHFFARGEPEVAGRFRPSSMEYVRSLGGDPLTMVSEMPLFMLPSEGPLADPTLPRVPRLEILEEAIDRHGPDAAQRLGIRPMPIRDQMRLQLALLDEGLRAVGSYGLG